MAYRVQLSNLVNRQIASWQLSDTMLVEVQLRLRRDLRENPAQSLLRLQEPFDGMCYLFSMVVPENRMREHLFAFQVLYHADEERILVARGGSAPGWVVASDEGGRGSGYYAHPSSRWFASFRSRVWQIFRERI